ncbi:MAG: M48 family metallopeptidase [Gammaproteobacteria bacterium]|nr:M48 family metallopeptidase [Gammaproteobacteria bacterium]
MADLKYLLAYPPELQARVAALIARGELGDYLANKYPGRHAIQTDKSLYAYALELKQALMRTAPPLHKVGYDGQLDRVHNALGLNIAQSRVQGGQLKAKKEIRIAALFKAAAPEFLRMIVVHELAHLRERNHDKAFHQLCEHMQPGYGQLEFDFRLYLTHRESLTHRELAAGPAQSPASRP